MAGDMPRAEEPELASEPDKPGQNSGGVEASLDDLLEKLGVGEEPAEPGGSVGTELEQRVDEMMSPASDGAGRPSSARGAKIKRSATGETPVFNTGEVLRDAVAELDQKRAEAIAAAEEAARAASTITELDEQLSDLTAGVLDAETPKADGAGRAVEMPEDLSPRHRDQSAPAGMVRMSEPGERRDEGDHPPEERGGGTGEGSRIEPTTEAIAPDAGVRIAGEGKTEQADEGFKGARIEAAPAMDKAGAELEGARIAPQDERIRGEAGETPGARIVAPGNEKEAGPDGATIAPENRPEDAAVQGAKIAGQESGDAPLGARIAPRPPESVPVAADHGPPLIPMPDLTAKYEAPKKPLAEKVAGTLTPAATKAVAKAAHAAAAASPVALHALAAASRPLANKPKSVRQSVGWIAANTLFVATVLWFYLLFLRHPSDASGAADAFDMKTSKLPAAPQPKVDAPKKEEKAEGRKEAEGHGEGGGKKESGHAKANGH